MRFRHIIVGLAIGLSGAPSAAWSIEIVETGFKTPIRGFVVREDAKKVSIRVSTPDGKDAPPRDFERSKITIIHQLNRDRLGKLSKEDPKAYRDYADELAKKDTDPEAKETALRLFAIAASLEPQQYGASCLLKMSSLASTPAEARKYRAMAFLLDPKGDPSVLKKEVVKPVQATPQTKAQTVALTNFQQALRFYRNGEPLAAKESAKRDGVDKYFGLAPGMMDQKSFMQSCMDSGCVACRLKKYVTCTICKGNGSFNDFGFIDRCSVCNGTGRLKCTGCDGTGVGHTSDDQLRIIIRAELWAVEQLSGGEATPKKGSDDNKWSAILQTRQLSPVPVLRLETITEFDLGKCIYRNGNWMAP